MGGRRIRRLILTGVVIAGMILPAAAFESHQTDDFQTVTDETIAIETDLFSMSYEVPEDRLIIKDKSTNASWYNIPPDADEDTIAQGSIRKELLSSLIVSFIDDKNNSFTANSQTSCVSRGTNKVYKTGNSILVEYDFSRNKEQFIIPVIYKLNENSFSAEILFEKIKEYGKNKICEIKLLPYFGAGKTGEEGFLLVPDGSGAIVDFQDNKSWAETYKKQIYGMDPAKSDYSYSLQEEQIYMPVYGIQKQGNAFLAIIEKGDANAFIEAIQAGNKSEYASIAPIFQYRIIDSKKMYDKYGTEKIITFESKKVIDENPVVSFYFTPEGKYGLADMAKLYRDYMVSKKGMKRLENGSSPSLFLDIYGVSEKKKSFLGILVDRPVAATTLSELQNMVDELANSGVNRGVMSLYYFNKSGTGSGVIRGFSLDGTVGSKSEFKSIAESAKKSGFELYYGINNIQIHRESWGWWQFNSGAINMFQTSLVEYKYLESIRSIDRKNILWFYLKPTKLTKTISQREYSKFKKYGIDGLVFQKSASILYSDNKLKDYSSRGETLSLYQEWYEQAASNNTSMLADGANAYVLPYSRYVTHVPVSTSRFDICTQPVPFYQMAFHGLKAFASTPLNEAEDSKQLFLKCILTGTSMNYVFTGKSPVVLRNTLLNTVLSSYYKDWLPEISEFYKSYQTVHSQLESQFITSYTRHETVEEVIFENGTAIAVNSGNSAVTFNGREIKPMSYITYHVG